MDRKIYFVGEGTVDGQTTNTEKFNQIINPDGKQMFEEVFQITECADFEKYKQKEEFMACILVMICDALTCDGDIGDEITVTAIDAETDIFLWGVSMNIIDDYNFQYTTLDWKSNGIFKYEDVE